MSNTKDLIYPPNDILKPSLLEKNYELIILWMLNNNNSCGWADFTEYINEQLIPESTLSTYLKTLKRQGYLEKPERNTYKITVDGKDRLNELLFIKESGGAVLNYPPKIITEKRNYDHWILWMLYNNESCRWSDFTNSPLSINQSSLSKNIKELLDKDLIKNENKEYTITPLGKSEYFNVLREYELDRQSILEEESKRIHEFTTFTNEFFNKFGIEDNNIKFRFLNNVLKLNYSKVENLLEDEEDFNKILLFLSINHPDQYPDYFSPERFSHEYSIKKTTLDFFIEKIVEEEFYDIKFFKFEVPPNKVYYFQSNEKIERLLRAIIDDYMTRYTYLNNLNQNTTQNVPALTISNIIESILNEICDHLFHNNLKDALRRFLPEYIQYLAYKIETEKKLGTGDSKLESLIWQTISSEFETFASRGSEDKIGENELNYTLDYQVFEALNLFYLDKLNYIEYNNIHKDFEPSNLELLNEIMQLLKNGEINEANNLFNDNSQNLNKIESLIINDIIKTSQYRFEESIEITNHLIQGFPNNYIGYLFQSITYFLLDNLEDSLKVIEKGITKAFDISLIAQKAQILIKKDEEEEGLKIIEEANIKHPNNILLLRTQFLTLSCEEGVCYRSPDIPLKALNAAIKLNPMDKELLILKAVILCITRNYKEAEKLITEQIGLNLIPKNPRIHNAAFLLLVYSYIARHKFEEALEFANIGETRYQDSSFSFLTKAFVLGYSLVYNGELSEVNLDSFKEYIDKAISIEKNNFNKALFLQSKAYILREQGINEEALDAIEEAIQLNPKHYDFYQRKIQLIISLGRDNEAVGLIDSMMKEFPKQRLKLYKIKSFLYFKLQDYDTGIKVIDKVLEEYPDDKHLLNNKVYLLFKLDRVERALEAAETLINIDPEDGNSYDTLGEMLMEIGKYEEALENFEEALKLNPSGWYIVDTYRKMSICHEKLGNTEEAQKWRDKMESTEPKMSRFYKDMHERTSKEKDL
ncbi:MAG: tetratricopeptide repeat protein [Candidatus Hodarchaeota archaeon]